MVCTAEHLASQAGLSILKAGGNAIDAAIATAACLTVVEPTANGIGGDAFALIWLADRQELVGLNSSGAAPSEWTIETTSGLKQIPSFGWMPVTVPGAPGAWAELSAKHGTLPLAQVLEPAIHYAEDGFPVSPGVAHSWAKWHYSLKQECARRAAVGEDASLFQAWFDTFTTSLGHAPQPGELVRLPGHAQTLRRIAESGAEAFYRGDIADRIDGFSRETGGFLRKSDLAAFKPEWVTPVKVNYRGYDVWEIPPNGQGIAALMALNLLKTYTFEQRDCADTYHLQIEAMKLAYADSFKYVADTAHSSVPIDALLSDSYADQRRQDIGPMARAPEAGQPLAGGTVFLTTADRYGNMVSMIQSNFHGFGSGLVVPGTGVALHNRGLGFSLDPSHANRLQPGKRPYHTIIPGFLSKDGRAVGPFGVMGGHMQPQGHLQVVMNTVDFHLNPQACLDSPRWYWSSGLTVELEQTTKQEIFDELVNRGHIVRWATSSTVFGRGQIIWRTADGTLCGATEPRADGEVAAW